MTEEQYEHLKKWRVETRESEIDTVARKYQSSIEEQNPSAEAYDYYNAVRYGAQWADLHPRGFYNVEKYINQVLDRKDITNKEFMEILQQFPEDALVSIEGCNPRAMMYDEKNNLIRID